MPYKVRKMQSSWGLPGILAGLAFGCRFASPRSSLTRSNACPTPPQTMPSDNCTPPHRALCIKLQASLSESMVAQTLVDSRLFHLFGYTEGATLTVEAYGLQFPSVPHYLVR
jgi:hypothetical protein